MLSLLTGDSTLLERLADCVWGGCRKLCAAGAATGLELHEKFVQEGGAFTMSYGGLDTFFGGLEGLIGELPSYMYMICILNDQGLVGAPPPMIAVCDGMHAHVVRRTSRPTAQP